MRYDKTTQPIELQDFELDMVAAAGGSCGGNNGILNGNNILDGNAVNVGVNVLGLQGQGAFA
jgi:hypothetical protein